jgi:SAM-dependent methyltransferase
MSEQYNQTTAFHYSAYRPPLHSLILQRLLSDQEIFDTGLEIGCGTGYSAEVLANYCLQVYGVDSSQAMLKEARPHQKITYQQGTGEDLPLPDKSVDVVTFAGSLFYAKSGSLIKELKRVCRKSTIVIAYDFEVLLNNALLQFGINPEKAQSNYDHEINFSDSVDFMEIITGQEQITFEVTSEELAHLLLSSSLHYKAFAEKYALADPFPTLVQDLEKTKEPHYLKTNIYFSKYRLKSSLGHIRSLARPSVTQKSLSRKA